MAPLFQARLADSHNAEAASIVGAHVITLKRWMD
jgi:hypothetical protein